MTIISRYLFSQYVRVMGLCLGSFITIFLVIDFLENYDKLTKGGAGSYLMALFFLYKIPEIVGLVMPMATLMATLLTLGLMSRNSEITALKGCGISLAMIAAPLMGTAFIVSLLMFANNEFIIPPCYQEMRQVERVLSGKKGPATFFRQDNIWYRQENMILQAKVFDANSRTLKGITVWQDGGSGRPTARIDAKQAELTANGLLLANVVVTRFTTSGVGNSSRTATMPLSLDMQMEDLKVVDKYADNMGFFQLKAYAEKLRQSGYDPTNILAQMHAKMAIPFASLVMAFLGIPFSLRGGRSSGIAMGIGFSLVIGFTYFLLQSVLLSFGQTGVLPPIAAAWAANFLFSAAGLWLILTVDT